MATEYAYPVLGGMPEHVHNLSKEMAARGHDVTVLTSMPPGMRRMARRTDAENLALHGYRTLRIGVSMPIVSNGSLARISAGIGAKPRIARALEGMDVVHAQGLAVPTICLWAIRASRAPVNVGTFHTYFEGGHWGYKYFFAYVRSTIARTDRLIAVSDACLTALRPYFRDQAFDVIPNGVDTELYRPLEPGEERPPGPPRILFVGRFDTRNRLDILLQAARILQDEGRDFVVQVVGDGPLRPDVPPPGQEPRRLGPDPVAGPARQGAPAPLPRGDGLRRALHPRLLRRGPARGDGLGHADRLRRQRRLPPGHPRRGAGPLLSLPATPGPSRPASPSSSTTRIGAATGASGAAPSRWSATRGRRSPAGSRSSTWRSWRPRAAAPTIARRWGCASTCAATRSSSSATCRRRCGRATPRSGSRGLSGWGAGRSGRG